MTKDVDAGAAAELARGVGVVAAAVCIYDLKPYLILEYAPPVEAGGWSRAQRAQSSADRELRREVPWSVRIMSTKNNPKARYCY